MVRIHQIRGRYAFEQTHFDFIGVGSGCQTGAVADPEDMCVHRHGGFAESHVQHHVGGLASYTGQGLQRFAGARHFAAVLLDQNLAGLHQVLGFAAK